VEKKKELHRATALWVVSDMRPYTIVEDVGWTYTRIIFISRKAGKPRGLTLITLRFMELYHKMQIMFGLLLIAGHQGYVCNDYYSYFL